MLASINRLKRSDNFEKIKKEGKMYQAEDFGVVVFKRNDTKPSKFGFIVSTKVAGEAVHRNRIKRALSEAVRFNLDRFPKGLNVLFLTKRSIFTKTTDEIMKQVEIFVSKNKL